MCVTAEHVGDTVLVPLSREVSSRAGGMNYRNSFHVIWPQIVFESNAKGRIPVGSGYNLGNI
jgi:hypothetical protein